MTADDQKRVIHAETHAGHHAWMLVSRLAAFVYDLVYASPPEKSTCRGEYDYYYKRCRFSWQRSVEGGVGRAPEPR